MGVWDRLVMLLVAALVTLAQAYGGNLGLAIIALSLSVRLALLPLTLRMAQRAQGRQTKFLALQPLIHKLKTKYRSDPQRIRDELAKLYRQQGYSPVDTTALLGSLIQVPIGGALYTAIRRGLGAGGRFLWISNLAQPDALLAFLLGLLTYLVAIISPGASKQLRIVAALLPALFTIYFVYFILHLASGVALYWATSSTVDMLQSAVLRRSSKQRGLQSFHH
jgi:YidC/Oxa1 family membrane protein insertase